MRKMPDIYFFRGLVLGLFLVFLYQPGGYATDEKIESLDYLEFLFAGRPQKLIEYHQYLLEVLLEREALQKYETIIAIPIYESDYVRARERKRGLKLFDFLDLLMVEAIAAGDKSRYCVYGGWLSLKNTDSDTDSCMVPWDDRVREDAYIKRHNLEYTGEFTCKRRDLFRCNPTIFGHRTGRSPRHRIGYPNPEKGICVRVNVGNPEAVISKLCYNAHKKNWREHGKDLQTNPRLLSKYLKTTAETIKFCREEGGNSRTCDDLLNVTRSVISSNLCCLQDMPNYPENLRSKLKQEIENVKISLEEYLNAQKKRKSDRQVPVNVTGMGEGAMASENMISDPMLNRYARHSDTRRLIGLIAKNSFKCIGDSCAQKKKNMKYHRKGVKPSGKSLAYCYRYVKEALKGSHAKGKYLPGLYASQAGPQLKRAGFINLLEIPKYRNMTPAQAPVGAIIVYSTTTSGNGTPGHIEAKLGPSKYGSDHIASMPVSDYLNTRKVIGIYIKKV